MALARQAKTLDPIQQAHLLAHAAHTPYAPVRNVVIVLLSYEAWMRATEIGALRWGMVTDASGRLADEIRLEDRASKGHSGRVIHLAPTTATALAQLYDEAPPDDLDTFVLRFRKASTDPVVRSHVIQGLFRCWYHHLRYHGASSHSGRRTGITTAARSLGPGMSLRDVQLRAGHTNIGTTQKYIDPNPEADRALARLSMIRPVMAKSGLQSFNASRRVHAS